MQYCTKCKTLCEDSERSCPHCKAVKKLRQVNSDDYVFLQAADEHTAKKLTGLFDEYKILYRFEDFSKGMVSYLYDSEVMPTDKNIYVEYSDIEIARGISANLDDMEEISEDDKAEKSGKNITKDVFFIIAFLVVITLVVLSADALSSFVMEFFKGLFK